MKSGIAASILKSFGPYLTPDWRLVQGAWMRRSGRWVQLLGVNPSRWDDTHELGTSLEYLPMPDPQSDVVGGIARNTVRHPNGTQRWISYAEHERHLPEIVAQATEQLRPSILEPLKDEDVLRLLETDSQSWTAPYCRCLLALEAGNLDVARQQYRRFETEALKRTIPDRQRELAAFMDLAGDPRLAARLDEIQEAKLASIRGRPLG